MKRIFFMLIVLSFVGLSCASIPRPWEVASGEGVVSNQYFRAWIKPASYDNVKGGYRAFLLTVQNKTDDVIVLDWNASRFIENGRENGGFIFSGVLYSMKDDPKAPDDVLECIGRRMEGARMHAPQGEDENARVTADAKPPSTASDSGGPPG